MFAIVKWIFNDVTDIVFKVGQAYTSLLKHAVLPELWLLTHTQSRGIDEGSGSYTTCEPQQCGILTRIDSDEHVQSPIKLRNSSCCSVSSLTVIEHSSD